MECWNVGLMGRRGTRDSLPALRYPITPTHHYSNTPTLPVSLRYTERRRALGVFHERYA